VTVNGLPVALLAIDSDAVAVPAADGLNVTDTVQVLPAAILAVHVFVWANDAALVPPRVTPDTVSDPVPVFVTVTVWAALVAPTVVEANVSDVGLALAVTDVAAAPVPVNDAVFVVAPDAATDSEAL